MAAQPELSETGLEGYRTTTDCDTTAPYTRSALLGALRIDGAVANGGTWPSVEAAAAKRAACEGGAQSPEEPAENKASRNVRALRWVGASHIAQMLRGFYRTAEEANRLPMQRQLSRTMIAQNYPKRAFEMFSRISLCLGYDTALKRRAQTRRRSCKTCSASCWASREGSRAMNAPSCSRTSRTGRGRAR